jgi:hypothetical protein
MTLQSKTALEATIAANLADNTEGDITPTLHRAVENNIADGIWGLVSTAIDDTDSPYTLDVDVTQVLVTDSTSGAITVNLPAVASSSGRWITVKHVGSANSTTLDGNASETIDGATTKVLSTQYDFVKLFCDGSVWHIISE